MFARILLAGAIAGLALPAAAQSSYFIVQDTHHHCSIVDQRPVSHDVTVVGPDGVMYKSRVEAETAMRTVKVCHDD